MSTLLPSTFKKNFGGRDAHKWTSGFFLLGVLISLVGSLLISWHAHIDTDPQLIGLHFLSLNVGYVLAVAVTQRLVLRLTARTLALASSLVACLSFVELLAAAPPISALWRVLGLGCLGYSAGTLLTVLLSALNDFFVADPLTLTNRAGVWFGCGSLVATGIVGATYFAGPQWATALLAIIPGIYFILFAVSAIPAGSDTSSSGKQRFQLGNERHRPSLGAILFSLLIFFQFGNEWAIAGWLPLFLVRRLGTNPSWAIDVLVVYFLALTFGRLLARNLLPRANHRKLLLIAVATSMVACLVLTFAGSLGGASVAIVIIAAGFAPIYPLVAETLDDRFSYQPRFYNSVFSIAITGAMSAPWLVGYVDSAFGIRSVMLVPALGSVAVLLCTLLFMLEARLMGSKAPTAHPELASAAKR